MKKIGYILLQLLLLGSLSAQEGIVGKLVMKNTPPMTDPVLPGLVLGLETDSETYILTRNHQWIEDAFVTVEGETYQEGSLVEVIGTIESKSDITGQMYEELEIERISKTVSNSVVDTVNCTLFYDKNTQSLVIDVGSESQEWTIVLFDVRGCLMLKRSNRGKCELDISLIRERLIVYQLYVCGYLVRSGKVVKC